MLTPEDAAARIAELVATGSVDALVQGVELMTAMGEAVAEHLLADVELLPLGTLDERSTVGAHRTFPGSRYFRSRHASDWGALAVLAFVAAGEGPRADGLRRQLTRLDLSFHGTGPPVGLLAGLPVREMRIQGLPLDGIRRFDHLERLILMGWELDLAPLAGAELDTLIVSATRPRGFDGLQDIALRNLEITRASLSRKDLAIFGAIRGLRRLRLNLKSSAAMEAVAKLPLRSLAIAQMGNDVSLEPIGQMHQLEELDVTLRPGIELRRLPASLRTLRLTHGWTESLYIPSSALHRLTIGRSPKLTQIDMGVSVDLWQLHTEGAPNLERIEGVDMLPSLADLVSTVDAPLPGRDATKLAAHADPHARAFGALLDDDRARLTAALGDAPVVARAAAERLGALGETDLLLQVVEDEERPGHVRRDAYLESIHRVPDDVIAALMSPVVADLAPRVAPTLGEPRTPEPYEPWVPAPDDITPEVWLDAAPEAFSEVEGLATARALHVGYTKTQAMRSGAQGRQWGEVDEFPPLPELRCLGLRSTRIVSVRSILALAGLEQLDLRWCRSLGIVRGLEALTNLRRLNLGDTNVRQVASLADVPLRFLGVRNCPIEDLRALVGHATLTSLDCSGNKIRDLPLSTMTQLREVWLENAALTTLPPLPDGLRRLSLASSRVARVPDLPPDLTHLDLRRAPIVTPEPLLRHRALRYLCLEGTPLSGDPILLRILRRMLDRRGGGFVEKPMSLAPIELPDWIR